MAELIYNEDANNLFVFYPGEQMNEGVIDGRVDTVAEAGATVFVMNVNAMKTNYSSKVWQSWWDGYDPEGPDDQDFFRGCVTEPPSGCRSQLDAYAKLARLGIDYVERTLSRCREMDMSPWISIRMNDLHGTTPGHNAFVSDFWLEHPEYRRHPARVENRGCHTLDYAEPEVRDHYRLLIGEVLERYDIDGLQLDFMRSPFLFRIGRECEGSEILTTWLRDIRRLVEAAGKHRNHPLQMDVRVPDNPTTALRFGFDVATWAREGLINRVIVTSDAFAGAVNFDMPIRLWRDLLSPHGVKVAGCLIPTEFRSPGLPGDGVNGLATAAPDTAVGAAVAMLYSGADGVELFNYFTERILVNGRGWSRDTFCSTLKAMRSMESMEPLRRKHIVSGRQFTAPGELIVHNPLVTVTRSCCYELGSGEYPLPAEGEWLAFRLQTGPRPTGRNVQVVIGMEAGLPGGDQINRRGPMVLVNDVGCKAHPVNPGDVLFTYDVPEQAFSEGEHVIEVIAHLNSGPVALRVTRVEFVVEAAPYGETV